MAHLNVLALLIVGILQILSQKANGFRFQLNIQSICNGHISIAYKNYLPPSEENQYNLSIYGQFPRYTDMNLKFDGEATVTLLSNQQPEDISARIKSLDELGEFEIIFFKQSDGLDLKVKGITMGVVPYLKSAVVNGVEYCENETTGYLDEYIEGYQNTAQSIARQLDSGCGKRLVTHTGLIVNGQPTKPGDWPWHAALYVMEQSSLKYICGGTLLSKSIVLTAAHCVTIRREAPRVPSSLSVVLGKYNLIEGDIATQEREVQEIIVHTSFERRTLNYDIALIRLKSEAVFDDYVQPACLWSAAACKKLPPGIVYGTVVGWGLDNTDLLTEQLQQARLPKISEARCLRSNPVFSKLLTEHKFCAGYNNGTSACNGDSGGGYMIFVPDKAGDKGEVPGAWYVRGIVSTSVSRSDISICNPNYYGLFTDVAEFRDWVVQHL